MFVFTSPSPKEMKSPNLTELKHKRLIFAFVGVLLCLEYFI